MKNLLNASTHTHVIWTILLVVFLFIGWNVHPAHALLSAPTGLSAVCGYGGQSVQTYWTPSPGTVTQAIRYDGAYPSWNVAGGHNPCNDPGNFCGDLGSTVNSDSESISPGVGYKWWVHALDGAGAFSDAAISTFNCPATYNLTITKNGTGSGSVSTDNAMTCGATCSKASISNSTVRLTPTASVGSIFSSWSGCDSVDPGTNRCIVSMSSAKNPIVTFALAQVNYTLSIGKTGSGNVVSNLAGISCTGTDAVGNNPTACSESYTSGTNVTLTATANASG